MKYQEEFFHNQIESIHSITEAKEEEFEKLLQEERAKARRFDVDSGTTENRRLRCVLDDFLDGANVVICVLGVWKKSRSTFTVNIVFVSIFFTMSCRLLPTSG